MEFSGLNGLTTDYGMPVSESERPSPASQARRAPALQFALENLPPRMPIARILNHRRPPDGLTDNTSKWP